VSSNANFFLNKTLGEDFMESLNKFELWKKDTKSVTDLEDIHLGLKIVPRTIMSFLIRELTPMNVGEHKDIALPLDGNCKLRVDKHGPDVFSGDIEQENKKIAEFKFRPIPGVGLCVMSTFELYSADDLGKQPKSQLTTDVLDKVQHMIDERMALHDLIGKVVDKKISERDAVQQLILAKITEANKAKEAPRYEKEKTKTTTIEDGKVTKIEHKVKKISPVKDFLEKKRNKFKKNENVVFLAKSESVTCPDCNHDIFDGKVFSTCVCFGDDQDSKVYIKKTEDGIKVRFGKSWEKDNIEMFLEVLKRGKHG
jgi:hypothetical protein